ncbi:hypothetical protein BC936DRAFT_145673 [Jimgerdemannia flammicorona]|uniref:Uncharacterized protein n=2 Tax=Jimgerdemannia flammicorona TaxID=994334 RepID=A0A433Q9U0_9FUNG|nr:hypothetical protein BC936DRAFT_145673 [Jimgerdemannia flammicorona]RUS26555.1 hypothetical protein BC938DRAFT_470614 [Jimgerdemannia flammicorona]
MNIISLMIRVVQFAAHIAEPTEMGILLHNSYEIPSEIRCDTEYVSANVRRWGINKLVKPFTLLCGNLANWYLQVAMSRQGVTNGCDPGIGGLTLVVAPGVEDLALVVAPDVEDLALVVAPGVEDLALVVAPGVEDLALVVAPGVEDLALVVPVTNLPN